MLMLATSNGIDIGAISRLTGLSLLTSQPYGVVNMAKHPITIVLPEGKTLDNIEWKAIPGFPKHQVSECGHVRKIGRKPMLSPFLTKDGYVRYSLCTGGESMSKHTAHRLVAMAFLDPPEPGQQVAHGNGDRKNNHFSNLRWVTAAENSGDRDRHGTTVRGEDHWKCVLTPDQVEYIRRVYRPRLIPSLAREFGVTYQTIWAIVRRQTWKHL